MGSKIVAHEVDGEIKIVKCPNGKLLSIGEDDPPGPHPSQDGTFLATVQDGAILHLSGSHGGEGSISLKDKDGGHINSVGWSLDSESIDAGISSSETFTIIFSLVGETAVDPEELADNARLKVRINGSGTSQMVYPYANSDGWMAGQLTAASFKATTGTDLTSIVIEEIWGDISCVTGDTLVTCVDGDKKIEDVVMTDRVISMNPATMQNEAVRINQIFKRSVVAPIEVFKFEDGTVLNAVHNHRVYHKETNSMRYIQEFKIGEHTVDIDGNFIKLVAKEVTEPIEQKIYFLVTKFHNFYSNGIMSGDQATKTMNYAV